MKTVEQLIEEKKGRDLKSHPPPPMINDPFVTMCAHDEERVILRANRPVPNKMKGQ